MSPLGAPTILFAGGGTGGHVLPGVATAQRLRALVPGARVLFATTGRDAGAAWGEETEEENLPLASPRLPRGLSGAWPFTRDLVRSVRSSLRALEERAVDGVVGLGGYGSVGPALAALLSGRSTVVLEANVVPGAANRLLTRLGARAAVSFDETTRRLPGRSVHTGNPLRPAVMRKRRDPAALGLRGDGPVLGVVGGSLGARGLNDRVASLLPILAAEGVELLWVTGAADAEDRESAARRAGVRASVIPYCRDMGALYGTVDVLVARSGGGTVAEVAALGVPTVFVPYPHHGDRQQLHNASVLASRGAAGLVAEQDLGAEAFRAEVLPLLKDPSLRDGMAKRAQEHGRPDAADRVARLVLDEARRCHRG